MNIQLYINERVDNTIKTNEDNDFHGFRRFPDKKMKNLKSTWPPYCSKTSRNYYWTNVTRTMRKNVLGWNDPQKLLRTVYFSVGKHFALRSSQEHDDLRHGMGSQIKIVGMEQEQKVIYQKDLSKITNGGLKHANYKAKTVKIFSTGGSHCPVEFTERYLEKIPSKSESLRQRENANNQLVKIFRLQSFKILPKQNCNWAKSLKKMDLKVIQRQTKYFFIYWSCI